LSIFLFIKSINISAAGDSCFQGFSTIPGSVKYAFKWAPDNPDEIARNSDVAIKVIGGIQPYIWSVSGNGFSLSQSQTTGLSNIIIADGAACGPAIITVTDYCGDVATGYVRCTEGSQWKLHTANTCVISGDGNCTWDSPFNKCELINGIRKQVQWTRYMGGGCCWADEETALYMCLTYGGKCDTSIFCHSTTSIACTNCIDPNHTIGIGQGSAGCEIYMSGSQYGYRKWCVRYQDYYEWECN
jgi:hypothetical protein